METRQATQPNGQRSKVLLVYTGGTIGMGRNPATGALEPLDFNHLKDSMPELQWLRTQIDVHQFRPPIDSSDMNPARWAEIVGVIADHYNDYDGFVILHGTDTMAYTAAALSFMMENLTKPVILTGSQLPIGQLRTDGKENLVTSIELASLKDANGNARVPEVSIYFSGRLLRGNRSTKINAEGFHAFESFNCPHLCEAGVNFVFNDPLILKPDHSRPMTPHYDMDGGIAVISLFPGIQEETMAAILKSCGLRGVVLRTFGSGNAPSCPWLRRLLSEAAADGVVVVNVSQCVAGSVEMERYGAGVRLLDTGIISGRDITVEAATAKLMYLWARYGDADTVRRLMATPLVGETTA